MIEDASDRQLLSVAERLGAEADRLFTRIGRASDDDKHHLLPRIASCMATRDALRRIVKYRHMDVNRHEALQN